MGAPAAARSAAVLLAALAIACPAAASERSAGKLSDPRGEAADILDERRFNPDAYPRPFKGVLERLAELSEPVRDFFRDVAGGAPGGEATLWTAFAALVLLLAALAASRILRGQTAAAEQRIRAAHADRRSDPAELERAAERAEREGRFDEAVRLRFRAGLLRLDRRELIEFRESLSTREVSRRLRSPEFDRVAAGFDEVAYGGRAAAPADAAAARAGWQRVLEEAA